MKKSLLALLAILAIGGFLVPGLGVGADDKPKEKDPKAKDLSFRELDELVYKNLRFVINAGAKLNNDGDAAACYRVFQGALMMTGPMLEHRPDLKDKIEKSLKALEALDSVEDKAFKSRELIDLIRATLKKDLDKTLSGDTLWDRIGGETAIRAIVQELLFEAANDDAVNLDRGGKFKLDKEFAKKLERGLVRWFSAQIGGPLPYSGKDMKAAHEGMNITAAEFDAMAKHLGGILERLQIPAKEAGELTKVFYKSRRDIIAPKKAIADGEKLWNRLGGEKSIRPIVHDFLEASAADPKVNLSRDGKYQLDAAGLEYLENMLVGYFSQLGGGPIEYTGRDLKTVHAGMMITESQMEAMAKHLEAAMVKHKIPEGLINDVLKALAATGKDVVEPAEAPAPASPPK